MDRNHEDTDKFGNRHSAPQGVASFHSWPFCLWRLSFLPMQFLNILIADLRNEHYIGCEPTDRSTWLSLMAYCAEQENGGRIKGCGQWKNRMWEQLCGVTKDEVHRESTLWEWDGDDLLPWNYPAEKEAIVRQKRTIGKRGGKASGKARREAFGSADGEAFGSDSLERKGREGKEMEENGMEGNTASAAELPNNHRHFIELWVEAYSREFGTAYIFQGGKDGQAVKKLLANGKTPEQWIELAGRAWKNRDKFNCKQAATIAGFSAKVNDIQAELLKPRKQESFI